MPASSIPEVCDVSLFSAFVLGTGFTAGMLLFFAIGCYIYMMARLDGAASYLPFRTSGAKFLFGVCLVKLVILAYFAGSILYQVRHGRPICRGETISYFLGWADWIILFLMLVWPAAALLTLLWNIYGDIREKETEGFGPVSRVPEWVRAITYAIENTNGQVLTTKQCVERVEEELTRAPSPRRTLEEIKERLEKTVDAHMEEIKGETIPSAIEDSVSEHIEASEDQPSEEDRTRD